MADITPDIRRVFEYHLNSLSGSLPPISWENVEFEPSTDTGYIEPRLVPSDRRPAVRGLNPQTRYLGYYLIEIHSPKGLGPNGADEVASTLIEYFEQTTDLSYGGYTVSLRYAERDLGVPEGAFYTVPVRIGYYIFN